jgi:hypothetical protein
MSTHLVVFDKGGNPLTSANMTRFIGQLQAATLLGNVEWEEADEKDLFQTWLLDHEVQLSTVRVDMPRERCIDLRLCIFSPEERLVDEIVASSSGEDFTFPGEEPAIDTLRCLYELARRSALGADQVLDELTAELLSDTPRRMLIPDEQDDASLESRPQK